MYKQNEARATKSNFWNNLRVKNNYSYADLASALDLAPSTVAMWFCGKVMPGAKHIQSLCELFGVDCNVGTQEFTNACNTWESTRPSKRPKKQKVTLVPMVSEDPMVAEPKSIIPIIESKPTAISDSTSKIFRKLYNKLSYDDYESFRQIILDGKDPLEYLYHKVDFEDYMIIFNIVKGIDD